MATVPVTRDPEREWLSHTRRGPNVPQLTAPAAVLGALLGAVTGVANVYVGLKIGWSLGVVLTASVLGWTVWQRLHRWRLLRAPSVLELNAMASTASAAGYSTGINLVSAVAAYAMVTGAHLPLPTLLLWTASVAGLGLGFAVLVKRRLINIEALPFPTGRAAAETLRALVSEHGDDRRGGRALGWGFAIGAIVVVLVDALHWLPPALPGADLRHAIPWLGLFAAYGFVFELSGLFVAAGVLVGARIAVSVFVGTVIGWGVVAPVVVTQGIVASPEYRDVMEFLVWVGVPMMVTAALMHLPRLTTIVGGVLKSLDRSGGERSPIEAVEIPRRWFWITLVVAGGPCVALQVFVFGIPLPLAVLAIALAGVLTIVAARVTGQTDVTPSGPLGKVTQLAYGGLMPGATIGNLMATGVTAGAATSAADLLTDLKSGWLLGADPRKQFWAQALGVLVGTMVVAPLFTHVLVPDPAALGSTTWPAPAAQAWRRVAELLGGTAGLPAHAEIAIAVAATLGVVLTWLERKQRWQRWIPNPTALGIGILMPASNGIGFVLGGLFAFVAARRRPQATTVLVSVAAGVIAGQSVLGLLVQVAS